MNSLRRFFDEVQQADLDAFDRAAKAWFRAQFRELGCVGARTFTEDWTESDKSTPLGSICWFVASRAMIVYEFKPIEIVLIGGARQDGCPLAAMYGAVGLRADRDGYSVMVSGKDGVITASYMWPDPQRSYVDGAACDSSHSDRKYLFDLADPRSLDQIVDKCLVLFDWMLKGQAPV